MTILWGILYRRKLYRKLCEEIVFIKHNNVAFFKRSIIDCYFSLIFKNTTNKLRFYDKNIYHLSIRNKKYKSTVQLFNEQKL